MRTRSTPRLIIRLALASTCLLFVSCGSDSEHPPGDHDREASGQDSIEGNLEVAVVHLDDGTTAWRYLLDAADGTLYELVLDGDRSLATGDRVRILIAEKRGTVIVPESVEILTGDGDVGTTQQALTGNPLRKESRVAVLLVNWSSPDGMTTSDMESRMFSGSTATREHYEESSYELVSLRGDVHGWLQVPAMSGCDTRTLGTNARAAARTAGIDIDSYDQVVYYFPKTSQCSWSGLAYVGRPLSPARDSWLNGSSGCVVRAHELLHNFGARHSRSYDCSGGPLASPGSCSYSEYGDPYDPMGGGCYHFNGYQKASQGWFGGCNVVTTSADAEFDLVPIALASNGIQTVRVPVSGGLCPSELSSCYYYLEYRQPLGRFDSLDPGAQAHDGILVHIGGGVDFSGGGRPQSPYLLDMNSGTSSFRDAALEVGRSFTDPAGTIITVVSANSSSARVRIQFPGGGSGQATCIDGGAPPGSTPPPPPPPPVSACATGEAEHGGSCYFVTSTATTHANAQAACAARGSGWSLAEIGSATENAFVSSIIGNAELWLGATDTAQEGEWVWRSGAPFWTGGLDGGATTGAYANFITGEPNDAGGSDCLRIIAGGGWRDIGCGSSYRAVCERRAN